MKDTPEPTVPVAELLAICSEYERAAADLRARVWRWRLATAALALASLAGLI